MTHPQLLGSLDKESRLRYLTIGQVTLSEASSAQQLLLLSFEELMLRRPDASL